MNEFEVAEDIKAILVAAAYTAGNAEPIFNRVLVTAGIDLSQVAGQVGFPWVLIRPGAVVTDDDSSDLVTARFTITLVQRVAQDAWGETAILGGSQPDAGSSHGVGLAKLQQTLYDLLALVDDSDATGLQVQLLSASAVAGNFDEDVGYMVWRDYEYEAWTGGGSAP